MKYQWFPIYDPELNSFTIIAPRTGHMVVSKTDYRRTPMPFVMRSILGTTISTRGNSTFERRDIVDSSLGCLAASPDPSALLIKNRVNFWLQHLPLSHAISLMRRMFPPARSSSICMLDAVNLSAVAFGLRSSQDCLPISICRHIFFRRIGIHSKIMLGAHIPTEKMHAWVQIGLNPILECPDVIVHYQTCVAYE